MADETPSALLRQLADAFDQGQKFQLMNVNMDVGLQFGERTLHFDLMFGSASQKETFEKWFEKEQAGSNA